MYDAPIWVLLLSLVLLLVLSAFFSGSETGLMALNRYRLRHLAQGGQPAARRAARLLEQPDRLIGLILLGNNFVNIAASSLATVIAIRLGGEGAIPLAAGLLTLAVLIFSEVAPKTLAALHPERVAFPAAWVYSLIIRPLYPLIWVINTLSGWVLAPLGVRGRQATSLALSAEELRTVVSEAGAMIPQRHQQMLLSILDLEKVTVEDIMVPRSEIVGIDLNAPWDEVVRQIVETDYTKLPVYEGSIDQVIGLVHIRKLLPAIRSGDLTREALMQALGDPYFIPEGTPLLKQIANFQRERRRIGLVVDEYGEIQGLVTLEDILEEIVGEFTTDPQDLIQALHPQEDGSYLVEGAMHIRDINRALGWHLPTDGPKTLNGLILEHMESIPEPGTSLLIAGHPVEIVQTRGNMVRLARIRPALEEGGSGGKPPQNR